MWRQRELEQKRKAAKIKYRQKHPAPCTFCGTIIKNYMYRHVARRHLESAQLWRCPVSWCTVWKGTSQDLMDHIRDAHNVPGEIRKVSLEMLFPLWTVTRQLYAESLTAQHSGISNDVLLFSEVGLSLVHHYRVHRMGRPHAAFRGKYVAQLGALLPVNTTLAGRMVWVPRLVRLDVAGGKDGLWIRLYRLRLGLRSRTCKWRQEPWCLIVVRHCCRFLWMSLVSICWQSSIRYRRQKLMLSLPNRSSHSGGGGGGRFAWFYLSRVECCSTVGLGTDLEDELPSPDASPVVIGHGVALLPAHLGENVDLAQVLAEFGTLPAIVTQIHDPQEERMVPPAECRTPDVHVDLLVAPAGPTVVPDDDVQPPTGSVGCSPLPLTTPAVPTPDYRLLSITGGSPHVSSGDCVSTRGRIGCSS